MVTLLIFLTCIAVIGIKFSNFHEDYISKPVTDSIKGIFTIIIILSHMRGYLPPPIEGDVSQGDKVFYFVINAIGQLMVVMFLFYSGYGIMESYKNKKDYMKTFLKKRILKTLFNFDIAILLYIILALILGKEYETPQFFISFTGWESIGNSNWFVFDILVLYLICHLCLIAKSNLKIATLSLFIFIYVLCGVFIVFLYFTKKTTYWYDTILAFPTGMLYSEYRNKIESTLKIDYWPTFFLTLGLFLASYIYMGSGVSIFTNCVLFSLLVVFISLKVKFDNKVLRWLGINCFSIYILQRIPMIIYAELGLNNNWILFSIAVIPTTLLISAVFTAFTHKLNKLLF